MGVEEARTRRNRLVISLALTFSGLLLLSYFLNIPVGEETLGYTGQFSLGSPALPVTLVLGLLAMGVIILAIENQKKHV